MRAWIGFYRKYCEAKKRQFELRLMIDRFIELVKIYKTGDLADFC